MNDQNLVKAFEAYMTHVERFAPVTIKTHMRTVTEWCNYLARAGAPELRDITDHHALDYIEANNGDPNQSAELTRRKLCSLRKLYQFMESFHGPSNNPFKVLPRMICSPPREKDFLTVDECQRMLAACDMTTEIGERDYTLIAFMWSTGLRVSETLGLKWKDVDLDEKTILVNGKGNKQRMAFLNDRINEELRVIQNMVPAFDEDYVFHNLIKSTQHDVSSFEKPLSVDSLTDMLKRTASKAGIDKVVTGKMFRHTFATHMYDVGVDYADIQEMLGHERHMESTIYIHVTLEGCIQQLKKTVGENGGL
jgi:site-specific recombinase XerD